MFPHPDDLYRAHQLRHAEMIRNYALERQARAARRPSHRFREIVLHIGGFVHVRRWWKDISTLFTRRSQQNGSVTSPLCDGALPMIAPPTLPLGSSASALTDQPETTRK